MSKNIQQVFTTNPITSNVSTDLMYFGRSPYGTTDDTAMTYGNFSAQFTVNVLTTKGDLISYSTQPVRVGVGADGTILQANSVQASGLQWTNAIYPSSTVSNQLLYSSASNTITGLTTQLNGVLVTNNSGTPSILTGSGTTGQVLQSNSSASPSWSTTTYPSTTTINQILYSSAANVVTGLSTLNNGVLITDATGVPSLLANSLTAGFVLTANSGAPPSWQPVSNSGSIMTINADSGSITPSAGVVTISGGTTGLTTSGSSSTLNVTGVLNLSHGGTNANLTASSGSVAYSTASALALSAVGSTGQIFRSTGTGVPGWTTATYPTTVAINQILYGSGINIVSGLPSASAGVLVTNGGGTPSILAGTGVTGQILQVRSGNTPIWSDATYPGATTLNYMLYSTSNNVVGQLPATNRAALTSSATGVPTWKALTDGQIVIGSSAGAPAAATITAGTGVTITNGSNTITISSTGSGSIVDQTTPSVTMVPNTVYIADAGASLITFTLPTTAALGDFLEIIGKSGGAWKIAQAAGQTIVVSPNATTLGAGGSLAATGQFDTVRMRCITANTLWSVTSIQSTGLTIV